MQNSKPAYIVLWQSDYQGNGSYLFTSVLFLESGSMVITRDYTDEEQVVRLMAPLFRCSEADVRTGPLKILKETGLFEDMRKLTLEEAYTLGWPRAQSDAETVRNL